jgi:hypothetical protein
MQNNIQTIISDKVHTQRVEHPVQSRFIPHDVIDSRIASLKELIPSFLDGKKWYQRDEIVSMLKKNGYHDQIAYELADLFLLHIRLAFERGIFSGIKAHMEHSEPLKLDA